ncbi:MAG: DUF3501 family protein [Myxococcota bacterium]
MPLDVGGRDGAAERLAANVLTPTVYAKAREGYRAYVLALKDRRRISLGPLATLSFENHETALYQIHEVLRVEGHSGARVAAEAREYSVLVPEPGELRATLLIDGECRRRCRALAHRAGKPDVVTISVAGQQLRCEPVAPAPDPEDPVRYLRFVVSASARAALQRPGAVAMVALATTPALSFPLPEPTRAELATDLCGARPQTRIGEFT